MPLLARVTVLFAALVLLAGCGVTAPAGGPRPSPSGSAAVLTVGSDGTPDGVLLAEIVSRALDAKGRPATTVTVAPGDALLQVIDGSVTILPTFARGMLARVTGAEAQLGAAETVQQLATELEGEAGVIQASGIDAGGVYVTTRAFSLKHDLTSLNDLGDLSSVRIVGPSAAARLSDGPYGLAAVYGVKPRWTSQDGRSARLASLAEGTGDVALFSRTELAAVEPNLVWLEDPLGLVQPDPQVLLVTPALVDDLSALQVLQAVQGALTTENFAALQVEGGRSGNPAAVQAFLAANGLA